MKHHHVTHGGRCRDCLLFPLSVPFLALLAVICAVSSAQADEFYGPFLSWADAKQTYGAVGDGKADDTAALQKALDEIGTQGKPWVLYLPAGTYRITKTLTMRQRIGISVLGESPDKTTVLWDGEKDGVMAWFDGVAYSRFGRITWDGAGKALVAFDQSWTGDHPNADTANEHADEVFRDVGFGIRAGDRNFMDAECAVLRCKFLRCSKAGVSIENFNALDWWIWDALFEDCELGVTNTYGAGHFHVYGSEFRRSKVADMSMGHTQYFGIRNNVSDGSKAFFVGNPIGAGANITLQDNVILDSGDATPIRVLSRGPLVLLDNKIQSRKYVTGPAVEVADYAYAVSIGNTYTVPGARRGGERRLVLDDRTVERGAPGEVLYKLQAPRAEGKVFEIQPGGDGAEIQQAIEEAAKLAGKKPVIHLPAGQYNIKRTLVVPAGCDVQIVGDGLIYSTVLRWAGEGRGPVVRLEQPSRAGLRHLMVSGNKQADGVVLTNCDQDGGRIVFEQAQVAGCKEVGLLVDGLASADALLYNFGHSGCGVGVKVLGPGEGKRKEGEGRVIIFSGASSNNELSYEVDRDGWLLVRDIWYESGQFPRFARFAGSGTFTMNGAVIAHPRKAGEPGVEVNDFRGKVTFIGTVFTCTGGDEKLPALVVKGEGKQTKLLALTVHGNGEYFANESPNAHAARVYSIQYTPGGGAKPIEDKGEASDDFIREMLAQNRSVRAETAGARDACLYRVFVADALVGIALRPAQ